jgi:hypothetical protein
MMKRKTRYSDHRSTNHNNISSRTELLPNDSHPGVHNFSSIASINPLTEGDSELPLRISITPVKKQ